MSRSRRLLWISGIPARAVLLGAIALYRLTLSGWLGGRCRFYPSCSQYALEAVRVHGATRGCAKATWRVLRCNPFGAGGVDHVPSARHGELVSRRSEAVCDAITLQPEMDADTDTHTIVEMKVRA